MRFPIIPSFFPKKFRRNWHALHDNVMESAEEKATQGGKSMENYQNIGGSLWKIANNSIANWSETKEA